MTSTANAEPKGSEPSLTDSLNEPCRCGHQRRRHLEPPGAQCVACSGDSERSWRHEFAPEKPECLHPEKRYAGALYDGTNDRKSFLYYACPDCMTSWKEEVAEPMKSDFLRCRCTHYQMNHRAFTNGGCRNCACTTFRLEHEHEHESAKRQACACGQDGCDYCDPEDPPLTAEEEEEVAGDEAVTAHADVDAMFEHLKEEPPPPQPDGRPPYAVAYSVQGHLYEVAVSGDASVRAVDGALVIQHRLGPVAAICQVLPITNEEAR